jgi:hypothetical protein
MMFALPAGSTATWKKSSRLRSELPLLGAWEAPGY